MGSAASISSKGDALSHCEQPCVGEEVVNPIDCKVRGEDANHDNNALQITPPSDGGQMSDSPTVNQTELGVGVSGKLVPKVSAADSSKLLRKKSELKVPMSSTKILSHENSTTNAGGSRKVNPISIHSSRQLSFSSRDGSVLSTLRKGLKSYDSNLRFLAMRAHSKQENGFIPQDLIMSDSRNKSLRKISIEKDVFGNSSIKSSVDGPAEFTAKLSMFMHSPEKVERKRPNLRITLGSAPEEPVPTSAVPTLNSSPDRERQSFKSVMQDDLDWIPVSDDEETVVTEVTESRSVGVGIGGRGRKGPGAAGRARLAINPAAGESYRFTQSGTIFVDGFGENGIRRQGLASDMNTARAGSKLSMRNRLVVLCRLGSGASSVVYKALDLRDMRLVALKMISVHERSKRRQMVRELTTLFHVLKRTQMQIRIPDGNANHLAEEKRELANDPENQSIDSKLLMEVKEVPHRDVRNNMSSARSDITSARSSGAHPSAASPRVAESKSESASSSGAQLILQNDATKDGPAPSKEMSKDWKAGDSEVATGTGTETETGTETGYAPVSPEDEVEPVLAASALIAGRECIVDFHDAFSNLEDGCVALMMEYMDGGSLQDVVDAGGCDDEPTLASIAVQALSGLALLHSCCQLHRDLKPGNFLISKKGQVKIGDFGILRDMENGSIDADAATGKTNGAGAPLSIPRANTFVGTATYMSPERIDGKPYSYPADVWAFGLSLMAVALGKLPIENKGGYWALVQSIRDNAPPQLPNDGRFSATFRDFLSKCLTPNPDDRWTCMRLLHHPFVKHLLQASHEGSMTSCFNDYPDLEDSGSIHEHFASAGRRLSKNAPPAGPSGCPLPTIPSQDPNDMMKGIRDCSTDGDDDGDDDDDEGSVVQVVERRRKENLPSATDETLGHVEAIPSSSDEKSANTSTLHVPIAMEVDDAKPIDGAQQSQVQGIDDLFAKNEGNEGRDKVLQQHAQHPSGEYTGLQELRAIEGAVFTHLLRVREDIVKGCAPPLEEQADYDRFYGDLRKIDVALAMRRLFFSGAAEGLYEERNETMRLSGPLETVPEGRRSTHTSASGHVLSRFASKSESSHAGMSIESALAGAGAEAVVAASGTEDPGSGPSPPSPSSFISYNKAADKALSPYKSAQGKFSHSYSCLKLSAHDSVAAAERLQMLAYQLDTFPEQVLEHVNACCQTLLDKGVSESFISTPRATHDAASAFLKKAAHVAENIAQRETS